MGAVYKLGNMWLVRDTVCFRGAWYSTVAGARQADDVAEGLISVQMGTSQ